MAPLIDGRGRGSGFTLLEVLLAVAVIASVAMLGSTLWVQASESSAMVQSRERGLRLQRVGSMLRDQWSDRRSLELPGESGPQRAMGGARFRADSFAFSTSRSILNPGSPLVEAEYLVRERPDGLFDLVYAEQGIERFAGAFDGADPRDAEIRASRRSAIVLLEGCEAIVLERFGAPAENDADDSERSDQEEGGAPERALWMAFDPDSEGGAVESDALRVSVRYRGEEAAWVLVARASR